MEMGEKFVENFFKDFGQKWKVRNGMLVFQKIKGKFFNASSHPFFRFCFLSEVGVELPEWRYPASMLYSYPSRHPHGSPTSLRDRLQRWVNQVDGLTDRPERWVNQVHDVRDKPER